MFSKMSTRLDPVADAKEYYDFSFYELGKYDLPAEIDYILVKSGQEKISFIGHS